jgi:hypothetical protein
MTTMPPPDGPATPRPDRELDDLITSHLDGGLDAAGQRRLAALLAASPEARATLARSLRLEAALVRLAGAGLLGDPVAASSPPAMPRPAVPAPTAPGSPRWLRPAAVAVAAASLATAVAVLVVGRAEPRARPAADIAVVAERWIAIQAAEAADAREHAPPAPAVAATTAAGPTEHEAADPERTDPYGAGTDEDDPGPLPGSPPSWLVAALADEGSA